MKCSLLVAASQNNAIGKDGKLLWHLPNDLKYFKNLTWGKPVLMGRKTFEAINKPLPGRINIVVTAQKGWEADGVTTCSNIHEALEYSRSTNCKEVFIIGGGEIYKQTIADADSIYLTRVHADLDGDTFFPDIDPGKWFCSGNIDFPPDEKHAYAYSFQTWKKK